MKKGRFLWSAHRITERQKAGKARSIKGKQLKNSRNTVSKQLVAHLSSASDNRLLRLYQNGSKSPENQLFRPIGTQCVMGVQSVRAKARRKLKCMSLRRAILHKASVKRGHE